MKKKDATEISSVSAEADKLIESRSEIMDKIDTILKKIDLLSSEREVDSYHSKDTSDLNAAMALASCSFPKIFINRKSAYLASGYSDLDEIMPKIRPVLGENNLHISQSKKLVDGQTLLITRIWHASGQWIESKVFIIPTKNTIESYGSRLNCMKRFEIMDLLGITVSNDPFDDDGESDMEAARDALSGGESLKNLYNPKEESYAVVSDEQYRELMIELDLEEELTEDILDSLKLRSLRELPRSKFNPTINRIRTIKEKRRTILNR